MKNPTNKRNFWGVNSAHLQWWLLFKASLCQVSLLSPPCLQDCAVMGAGESPHRPSISSDNPLKGVEPLCAPCRHRQQPDRPVLPARPCTCAHAEGWCQRHDILVLAQIAGEGRINPCSAKCRSLPSPGQKYSQDSAQFGSLNLIYWHLLSYCVNILFTISVSHFGKCCYKSGELKACSVCL